MIEVMFYDQFTGLGRTVFTGGISDSTRTLHWEWYRASGALLSPLCKTFSLYEVEAALMDLCVLDGQHVNQNCK